MQKCAEMSKVRSVCFTPPGRTRRLALITAHPTAVALGDGHGGEAAASIAERLPGASVGGARPRPVAARAGSDVVPFDRPRLLRNRGALLHDASREARDDHELGAGLGPRADAPGAKPHPKPNPNEALILSPGP